MAIVLVEQYFDFGFELADRITVLKRGAVVTSSLKTELSREAVLEAVAI